MKLLGVFVLLWLFRTTAGDKTCPIGEDTLSKGPCNTANGQQDCESYCRNTHGPEVVKTECVGGQQRPEGMKECICHVGCGIATWEGDPHYLSYDGLSFDFNEVCLHVGASVITQSPGIPKFNVFCKNRRRIEGEHISFLDKIEIHIPDWQASVVVDMATLSVKVNGFIAQLPFRFTKIDGHRELFVVGEQIGHAVKFVTSFGLTIEFDAHGWTREVGIRLPRTPSIMGNVHGAFGNFDGNKQNDAVDAYGIQRDPNNSTDMELFGLSWCMDESFVTEQQLRESQLKRNRKLDRCLQQSKQRLDQLCGDQFKTDRLACFSEEDKKRAVRECITDVCYAIGYGAWAESQAACGVLKAHLKICGYDDIQCLQ